MLIRLVLSLTVSAGFLAEPTLMQAQEKESVTAAQVRAAIDKGVEYLKRVQNKSNGSWTQVGPYPKGASALCALALLECGEDSKSAHMVKAIDFLRAGDPPEKTYVLALQTMVLAADDPEKHKLLILRNARLLERSQVKEGIKAGGWGYGDKPGADPSNTQFAILALHEAERAGVKVNAATWQLAMRYWMKRQELNGGWRYSFGNARGSMTSAGLASLIISSGKFRGGDARAEGEQAFCCGSQRELGVDDRIQRGLQWLAARFTTERHPVDAIGGRRGVDTWWLYYMYCLERVGRLTGQQFIGTNDWYRAGAASLIRRQAIDGSWTGTGQGESDPQIGTAFALLFLAKGRRPVLMSKLKFGSDRRWSVHRNDVHNLTRYVESRWDRDLTWQIVDLSKADLKQLLQSPVLVINGEKELTLSLAEKNLLRSYVEQGGFIFAQACDGNGCDGQAFDRSFRALLAEIFPNSKLSVLPPEHPVWYAEEKVPPRLMRRLEGLQRCCRTSVVYCPPQKAPQPSNLSCYWQLGETPRREKYSRPVEEQIQASLSIGLNVLAYATNRELKNKLDVPRIITAEKSILAVPVGTLAIAKIDHGRSADDAPAALPNLLGVAKNQLNLRLRVANRLVALGDKNLAEYPILFIHGRGEFKLSEAERKSLKTYLENGGFLFGDALCADAEFARTFGAEMARLFPDKPMERIPENHAMFTEQFRGHDVRKVTLRDPTARGPNDTRQTKTHRVSPLLEGIKIDGRYSVVFSPYDLSCALENATSIDCKGYTRDDAAKLGVNIVLYALQQ